MERKNAWKKYSDEDKNNVFTFAEEYRTFISECKTERECVKKAVALAEKAGYRDLQEIIAANETLKAGDKVYAVNLCIQLFLPVLQPSLHILFLSCIQI